MPNLNQYWSVRQTSLAVNVAVKVAVKVTVKVAVQSTVSIALISVLSYLLLEIVGLPTTAMAQSPSGTESRASSSESSANQTTNPSSSSNTERPSERQGGGSMADFTELINLIQSTVDGQWDSEEDKLQPYTNGVWIDPKGKLHRQKSTSKVTLRTNSAKQSTTAEEETKNFTRVPMLDQVGLDQEESLRWISLRQVEEMLVAHTKGSSTSIRLELLGGLTRIDHLARDPKTNDWYIGGPAGGMVLDAKGNLISRSNRLPPILLEDLLSVAPIILHERGPLGCSIDPDDAQLNKVSEHVRQASFLKQLTTKPEKASQSLAEILGDQRATFFGLPAESPSAVALLVADEHMKRLGLGLASSPPGITNYWEACERLGEVPGQTILRWWFALPESVSIGVDESGDVFSIESSTVRVLGQKQFLDLQGVRHDAVEKDLAATAFAESFTKEFAAVQKQYPVYGRLRHIFDLAVAMQIIANETPNSGKRPLGLTDDEQFKPTVQFPIRWVPSISAWRKTSNGRIAAVVSGGVMLEPRKLSFEKVSTQKTIERKSPASLE